MRDKMRDPEAQPQSRNELVAWVRKHLNLPAHLEASLFAAFDAVFTRHERLWQESKHEAIQALSAGFAEKMAGVKTELSAKDATVSSISQLLRAARRRPHRQVAPRSQDQADEFGRFTEQLESFLALEQRGRWCAVGLVDITGFKWYNDALGHAVGDRIIERVAHLLREQVRSDDLIAQERDGPDRRSAKALDNPTICTRASAATSSVSLFPILPSTTRPTRSPSAFAKRSNATTGRSRTPAGGAAGSRRRRGRRPVAGPRGGTAIHRAAARGGAHSARR